MQAMLAAASGFFILAGIMAHALIVRRLAAPFGGGAVPNLTVAAYAIAIALGGRYVIVKASGPAPAAGHEFVDNRRGSGRGPDWRLARSGNRGAFLFALSLALESWSVGRARHAIAALLDLAPPTARLVEAGAESEVPAAEVPGHPLAKAVLEFASSRGVIPAPAQDVQILSWT